MFRWFRTSPKVIVMVFMVPCSPVRGWLWWMIRPGRVRATRPALDRQSVTILYFRPSTFSSIARTLANPPVVVPHVS